MKRVSRVLKPLDWYIAWQIRPKLSKTLISTTRETLKMGVAKKGGAVRFKIGNNSYYFYKGLYYHNPLRNRSEIILSHRIPSYILHISITFGEHFFSNFRNFFSKSRKKILGENFLKFSQKLHFSVFQTILIILSQ